jgi:hypothetical protein
MLDVGFLFQTLMEIVGRVVLSPLPLLIVPLYWIITRRGRGQLAGLPWLFIALTLQILCWHVHYAPYVPLILPSYLTLALNTMAAGGIWMFARSRVTDPWKWSVPAFLPVLGPLLVAARLSTMPITFPVKRSFKGFIWTAGAGYTVLLFVGLFLWFGQSHIKTVLAPDRHGRIVVTGTRFMDLNMTFEWQRLLGPFVIQAHHFYKTPDEVSTAMTIRWSQDSTKVLISGPKFDVVEPERLRADRLYFLYEPGSAQRWTNARGDRLHLPRFTVENVASIPWTPSLHVDG